MIAALALVLALQGQAGPYADSATAALIARARERHRQQDAAVQSYQARLRTRLDAELGHGSFARFLPFAVEEQEADLSWQAPNDVKVVMLGRRYRTAFAGLDVNSSWTRPWFVPRFLGDSIRLLSSDGFPERAAIHPLSSDGDAYYRYAIEDSMQLVLPGRTVRAIGVRITPVRADASLIAGELWLDATTAETVRLSMVFVGKRLWVDSIGPTRADSQRADRTEALVQRVLRVAADLEYGLYEQRYWLPYRQAVTLDVRLPWFANLVIPVHFVTTFRDVRVNTGAPITFAAPPADSTPAGARHRGYERRCREAADSGGEPKDGDAGGCVTSGTWAGGRYEVAVPPDSALLHYAGWTDSLRFALSDADAAQLGALRDEAMNLLERLPDSLTGRSKLSVAFDRFTDIWRYNRAEGASLGWGYAWRPGVPFLSVLARARYAFTDRRVQGALTLRRQDDDSRLDVEAYREMRDADVLAPGLTFTNSLGALWFARDDGAYLFAQGGLVRYQRPLGRTADLSLQARYGEESAPRRLARSGLNDLLRGTGVFPPNAPVLPGHYAVGSVDLASGRTSLSWRAGVEGTMGTRRLGRGWMAGSAHVPLPGGLDLAAAGWAGAGAGDSIPQRDFRLGGDKTLRGYAAGTFRGMSAWALDVDVALARHAVTPVVFADAGQVAPHGLRFTGAPAASIGAGLSFFGGIVRLDAARPIAPHAEWRVSLVMGARR